MKKNIIKDSFKFTFKNLLKLMLILAMNISLISIVTVIPLWVLNSEILFKVSLVCVLPLTLCCLSTYIASLMRENNSIYNSFLLFEKRYVRNITMLFVTTVGMFAAPLAILNKDVLNENMQIIVMLISIIISVGFYANFRYLHLVLAENPNMSVLRVLRKNKEIMKNNKISSIIISTVAMILPFIGTCVAYNKLYDQVSPLIIVTVGFAITYLIKEVVDVKIYRNICGHVYLQFDKLGMLNAPSNSNKVMEKVAPTSANKLFQMPANMEMPKMVYMPEIVETMPKVEYVFETTNQEAEIETAEEKYNRNLQYVKKFVK